MITNDATLTQTMTIHTPLTKQDVVEIGDELNEAIEHFRAASEKTKSVYARQTFDDVVDVLASIRDDLDSWGKRHARLMHEDGFC